MKTRFLLSVIAVGLFFSSFSQKPTMELTFIAENNNQYVPLDSILIENVSQGGDTTLYAPDTMLVMGYITSISDNETIVKNSFSVSQNYPNPFIGKTEIDLHLPNEEYINISVRDILGRELARYENTLKQGNHTFSFYPDNEKYCLLAVTGKQTRQTIKMLNAGSNATNGEKCKIVYTGNKGSASGFKSRQAINNFGFDIGDELKYTAYTDVEETEIIDSPTSSQVYTFQFDGWVPCPVASTVTDIDGNTYNSVQIGEQCWMKENLKTTTYKDGTPIPNVTNSIDWANLTTGAYVWYDNNINWKNSYGGLYNWFATVDSNGLCPTGWHVSTKDEWIALTDFIGGTGSPHGSELKSCRQVDSPLGEGCNTTEHPRWNESFEYGTDIYGFSGLSGGKRRDYGEFDFFGYIAYWWAPIEGSSSDVWVGSLSNSSGHVNMYYGIKGDGFSVRCLRD